MKVAYVRVSTAEQNEARQSEALKPYGIERWYTEKISASTTARPQLQAMLQFVREGDVVYIHDFSRLARNTSDLLMIVEDLHRRGITLVSSKENLDTGTATGKLMLTVIAAINEFEREILLERQREGIAIAKQNNVYKGRVAVKRPMDFDEQYRQYYQRKLSKTDWAKKIGVSRPTLDRLISEYEAECE